MFNPTKTSIAFCLTAGLALPAAAGDHAEAAPVEAAAEAVAETVEEAGHDHAGHDHVTEVAADASAAAVSDNAFDNEVDEVSYAIGLDIGGSFRTQDIDINPAVMAEALAAAYTDAEVKMTDEQAMAAIQRFQQAMQAKQMQDMMAQQQAAVSENTTAAEAFFAENQDKEGVQETESGLQYQIIELGEGAKPGPTDQVTLHYKGQLLNGEVFDSSYDRGEPITLGVHEFVLGFGEGLQQLPVGSKGKLFIPGELAYGMQGGPGGPMAALIFDVEILAAVAPEAPETVEDGPAELPALGD